MDKCLVCKATHNDLSACDYELCGTCGFDHEYDFPFLSAQELNKAHSDHKEAEG